MLPISNYFSSMTWWMHRVMGVAICISCVLPLSWAVKFMGVVIVGILAYEIKKNSIEAIKHRYWLFIMCYKYTSYISLLCLGRSWSWLNGFLFWLGWQRLILLGRHFMLFFWLFMKFFINFNLLLFDCLLLCLLFNNFLTIFLDLLRNIFFFLFNIFSFRDLFLFWRSINVKLVHSLQYILGIISTVILVLFLIWIFFPEIVLLLTHNSNKILEMLIQIDSHGIVESNPCLRLSIIIFWVSSRSHINWIVSDWLPEFLAIDSLKHI